MKYMIVLVSIAFLVGGCGGGSGSSNSAADDSKTSTSTSDARYKVTFQSNWTATNFSTAFPNGNEHFSGLVGATHSGLSGLWETGTKASQGIKLMAETGNKDTLKNEAASSSDMNSIDGGGIPVGSSSVSLEFSITKERPLLTLTSMVAPSPDWFVGVSGLNLYDSTKNDWIESIVVPLKIYDAGTDSGSSFASANLATFPAENISVLTESEVDISDGVHTVSRISIGSFTIERL